MTKKDYEFIADEIAPMMHWPTHIEELADKLQALNSKFDKDKFVARAIEAWEENYQECRMEQIDDNIPY
tara:strand:- start:4810 stop:5016 length:207 start_codon:yes stop_codon:yes gene_type:complete